MQKQKQKPVFPYQYSFRNWMSINSCKASKHEKKISSNIRRSGLVTTIGKTNFIRVIEPHNSSFEIILGPQRICLSCSLLVSTPSNIRV